MRSLTLQVGAAGALIDVDIGLSDAHRRAMQRLGMKAPPYVQATLLIDTGASSTLVDEGLMRTLQLQPTSATLMHSSSTKGVAQPCSVYDVGLVLGGLATPNAIRFDPLPVLGTAFINSGCNGLLGRDVLRRLHLHWNGPAGTARVEYN